MAFGGGGLQAAAASTVAALVDARLIKPWPLTLAVGNQPVKVEGLSRVDEAALNALDDAAFIKLRKASALVIAHGQLLSTPQTTGPTRLAAIAERMSQTPQVEPPQDSSDMVPV
jgi:SapC